MIGCETLVGAALFACLAADPRCLPQRHRHLESDLRAIAAQESGFRHLAVRDEAAREAIFPATYADAVRIAVARDALGRLLGLGWFQITGKSNWDRHFGRSFTVKERAAQVARVLDPCENMRAGADHYAADLADELARLRGGALSRYNSGRHDGAPRYAEAVLRRLASAALPPGLFPTATRRPPGQPSPADASPPESRPPTSPFVKRTAGRSFTYGNQEQVP